MKKLKLISGIITLSILTIFFVSPVVSASGATTLEVPGTYYEMPSSKNYNYTDHEPVTKMTYGKASVGQLVVSGTDIEKSSYAGKLAFGTTGNVSFSYVYDNALLGANDDVWHMFSIVSARISAFPLC